MDGAADVTADNWKGSTVKTDAVKASARWTTGLTALTNEQSAGEALETVLTKGGCALHRDALDTRIVSDVRSRNGKLINTPSEAGGYPTITEIHREDGYDTDRDGMPDTWEDANGLNKNSSADGKLYTLDQQYTNLEVYLNSLVKDLF